MRGRGASSDGGKYSTFATRGRLMQTWRAVKDPSYWLYEMNTAKTRAIAALALCVIALAPMRGFAAAGTSPASGPAPSIFVANPFNVAAFPADGNGDLAPIVPPTNMINPRGVARDARGRIYVTNGTANTVTVYAAGANGNVPPLAVIGGANTGFTDPNAIAIDASGKIYVLNLGTPDSIMVYPPLGTSTGVLNEAPIATIAGTNTLLASPDGIALDSSGDIYVANENYATGSVNVYAAGSNGNAAPIATISGTATGLYSPAGIALDAGGNIYVANNETVDSNGTVTFIPSITVYPAGSNGNATPTAIITGDQTGLSSPGGIAIDASRNLYVTSFSSGTNSIDIFAAGSNGNVAPGASITGGNTGLFAPIGVVLDSTGNIYVVNNSGGPEYIGSVTVYSAGSTGDAIPTATITSNLPGLDYASGIALDSIGNIYVANEFNNAGRNGSINIYPPGSYAAVAPAATIAGANTGLNTPFGIALDSVSGIAVLNGNNSVTEYPADSAGDVTPSATIDLDADGNFTPVGIAMGPSDELYVVNQRKVCERRFCFTIRPGKVTVFPAGSDGNARPTITIRGHKTQLAYPSAITVDQTGDIYVANQGPGKCFPGCVCLPVGPGSVTVYDPGSKGNVKPATTISGPNTGIGLPYGITLDSSGNIYVLNTPSIDFIGCIGAVFDVRMAATSHAIGSPAAPYDGLLGGSVLIFAAGSSGNVAPIATIGGPLTGFDYPSGIAVGPGGL